jgi:hypothetical protein
MVFALLRKWKAEDVKSERFAPARIIHSINSFKNSCEWAIWPDEAPYCAAPNVTEPLLVKSVAAKIRLLHWKFLSDPRFRFVDHPIDELVEFA